MRNYFIVIENGQLKSYSLDERQSWEIGRCTEEHKVDIPLHSETVSRKHGMIHNLDGIWFYIDCYGTNGTIYNQKHMKSGFNGRIKPIILEHRDTFVFGVSESAKLHNCKPVWAMYSTRPQEGRWRSADTRGMPVLEFSSGEETRRIVCPEMGTVIEMNEGMAICMNDITYLMGNISLNTA